MLISLIVPVFNQAGLIEPFFNAFRIFNSASPFPVELIMVNDGSTDDSLRSLTKYKRSVPNLNVVSLSENKGQGAAIVSALSEASGDIALTLDLDMHDCFSEIPGLINAFLHTNSDVVKVAREFPRHTSIFRKSVSFFFNLFIRFINAKSLSDIGSPVYMAKRCFYQKLTHTAYASFRTVLPVLIFKLAGDIPVIALQKGPKSKSTSSYDFPRLFHFAVSVIYHLARPLPKLNGSSFAYPAPALNQADK